MLGLLASLMLCAKLIDANGEHFIVAAQTRRVGQSRGLTGRIQRVFKPFSKTSLTLAPEGKSCYLAYNDGKLDCTGTSKSCLSDPMRVVKEAGRGEFAGVTKKGVANDSMLNIYFPQEGSAWSRRGIRTLNGQSFNQLRVDVGTRVVGPIDTADKVIVPLMIEAGGRPAKPREHVKYVVYPSLDLHFSMLTAKDSITKLVPRPPSQGSWKSLTKSINRGDLQEPSIAVALEFESRGVKAKFRFVGKGDKLPPDTVAVVCGDTSVKLSRLDKWNPLKKTKHQFRWSDGDTVLAVNLRSTWVVVTSEKQRIVEVSPKRIKAVVHDDQTKGEMRQPSGSRNIWFVGTEQNNTLKDQLTFGEVMYVRYDLVMHEMHGPGGRALEDNGAQDALSSLSPTKATKVKVLVTKVKALVFNPDLLSSHDGQRACVDLDGLACHLFQISKAERVPPGEILFKGNDAGVKKSGFATKTP